MAEIRPFCCVHPATEVVSQVAFQKKGVNAVIISKVMHGCFKIGVKQAETGPMLETNEKVQTQWQDFPLEQHKRRRCFVKVLTPAPQESVAAATAPAGAAE